MDAKYAPGFQFPSNGKGFPNLCFCPSGDCNFSFNSLQTGKAFRTVLRHAINIPEVIVFQFPSNGKGFPNADIDTRLQLRFSFQFPSNGKGFPNLGNWLNRPDTGNPVSIPFKRERLSEQAYDQRGVLCQVGKFQFPSNGKGFPNS